MNKWIGVLSVILVVSLTLNIYFVFTVFENGPPSPLPNDVSAPHSTGDSNYSWTLNNEENQSDQTSLPSKSTVDAKGSTLHVTHEQSRSELLTQTKAWLDEKNFSQLSTFLQSYLKRHPQDMDFLLVEAEMMIETTLLSEAIVHYYSLLSLPMHKKQQEEIEKQIERLSKSTIEQLKNTFSWDVLAAFIEPLIQIEPTNREYILALARAYAELLQETLMEDVLASLPYDDPAKGRIRRIVELQKIAQFQREQENTDDTNQEESVANVGLPVSLKQYGDQYVVNAKLAGNNVDLLIDTGASITAISRTYFQNLSNKSHRNFTGRFLINTASGQILAPIYKFQELTINHAKVENISVVILPMEGMKNAEGLLGMNFLREFDFKIDQRLSIMFIK